MLPDADGRFLGETTTPRRWDGSRLINLKTSQLTVNSSLIPNATKTYDLGSSTKYFRDAYLRKLFLSPTTNEGLASHILPVAKGFYDLGNLTRYMRSVHFNFMRFMNLTNDTHYSEWSYGSTGYPLDSILIRIWDSTTMWDVLLLDINTGVQFGLNAIPMFDDSFNLGDETLRWMNLFLSQYLKLGNVASLPTPDASYRGKMIRVEDASGDKLYICEWNGSAYVWRQI